MLTAVHRWRMVSVPLREVPVSSAGISRELAQASREGRVAVAVGIRNPGLSMALPSSRLPHSPDTGRQYQPYPSVRIPNIPTGGNNGGGMGGSGDYGPLSDPRYTLSICCE